ncbi:MAG: histidine kinase [Propionibacteriaceae bacterium]|jgi:signal transduction histidine kinase|nr:histidine kinase [Propionibacteriaceae bacterium]
MNSLGRPIVDGADRDDWLFDASLAVLGVTLVLAPYLVILVYYGPDISAGALLAAALAGLGLCLSVILRRHRPVVFALLAAVLAALHVVFVPLPFTTLVVALAAVHAVARYSRRHSWWVIVLYGLGGIAAIVRWYSAYTPADALRTVSVVGAVSFVGLVAATYSVGRRGFDLAQSRQQALALLPEAVLSPDEADDEVEVDLADLMASRWSGEDALGSAASAASADEPGSAEEETAIVAYEGEAYDSPAFDGQETEEAYAAAYTEEEAYAAGYADGQAHAEAQLQASSQDYAPGDAYDGQGYSDEQHEADLAIRTALAGEVHDGVAHALALVANQAEDAKTLVGDNPDDAGQALDAIVATCQDAMAELRRIVDVLKAGQIEEAVAHLPTPTWDDVPALAAGAGAGFNSNGEPPRPLDDVLGLTIYRIVQEALTNVLQHAGPDAGAQVYVDWGDDDVEVSISNEPTDFQSPGGGGQGLDTMAERVEAVAGLLETGPSEDGGFRVWASLPYDIESAETAADEGEADEAYAPA